MTTPAVTQKTFFSLKNYLKITKKVFTEKLNIFSIDIQQFFLKIEFPEEYGKNGFSEKSRKFDKNFDTYSVINYKRVQRDNTVYTDAARSVN